MLDALRQFACSILDCPSPAEPKPKPHDGDKDPTERDDGDPPWLRYALGLVGLHEGPGGEDNPAVVKLMRDSGATWFPHDSTPWCGLGLGGIMVRSGVRPPPAKEVARARAWEDWGADLKGPARGCVVVFWRVSMNSGKGHVGLVVGKDHHNRLMVLGCNQRDSICIEPFARGRVTAYRWPLSDPDPAHVGWATLPFVNSHGQPSSHNEV